jgi:hypothetical protein
MNPEEGLPEDAVLGEIKVIFHDQMPTYIIPCCVNCHTQRNTLVYFRTADGFLCSVICLAKWRTTQLQHRATYLSMCGE